MKEVWARFNGEGLFTNRNIIRGMRSYRWISMHTCLWLGRRRKIWWWWGRHKRVGLEGTWEPTVDGENDPGGLRIREEEESTWRGWERLKGIIENKGVWVTGWDHFWTLSSVNLDKFWSSKEWGKIFSRKSTYRDMLKHFVERLKQNSRHFNYLSNQEKHMVSTLVQVYV